MLIQYQFHLNITFLLCKVLRDFTRLKAYWTSWGNSGTSKVMLSALGINQYLVWLSWFSQQAHKETKLNLESGSDPSCCVLWIQLCLKWEVSQTPQNKQHIQGWHGSCARSLLICSDNRFPSSYTHIHRHTVARVYTHTPSPTKSTHIFLSLIQKHPHAHTHGQLCGIP